MRQFWWPRYRALGAVLAFAAALVGATVQAQTAMTCDAASFEKLGLPKTRIVSASAVKDDARAGRQGGVLGHPDHDGERRHAREGDAARIQRVVPGLGHGAGR